MLSGLAGGAVPAIAWAEQASQPGLAAAGRLDVGANHSCALLDDGKVRCWGFGADGQLGYGSTSTIGDDETPGSVAPVDFGAGRTATAISAGDSHTCALLDDGTVRCWGFGVNGRLGYANQSNIGDKETLAHVGPVDLGMGRTATAIAAGGGHTCAILDTGNVLCWGFGINGQLGYGIAESIGDDETPGSHAPVNLGNGRTAIAITAGELHSCALLDNHMVRCWGYGLRGALGYGSTDNVGDTPARTPDTKGPVNLGMGRTASAIAAGDYHTCALLDNGTVRCWGFNQDGQLGYGNVNAIGDDPNQTPDMFGPVSLGRPAVAITAGGSHTCAILDDQSVRCWGNGADGRLGYGNTASVGDTPSTTPDTKRPVDLGAGRKALAISAGLRHTCARLDDASVRCWGYGGNGRLGYCNSASIGDDESPGSAGPVALETGGPGANCVPPSSGSPPAATAPGSGAAQRTPARKPPVISSDAARGRGLRICLAAEASHARREKRLARQGSARRRARARRHLSRHARSGRRRCLRLFSRTPGRITGLRASARGRTQIELTFNAAGTDGKNPPPARSYLVTQSLYPLGSARDFARAQRLCKGACRFAPGHVGGKLSLAVTDLRPQTTYYYSVVARDNVSARRGPHSQPVKARTR